jgi:HK97 family phage major capsid protein
MIKVKRGEKEIYLKDESALEKGDELIDKNVDDEELKGAQALLDVSIGKLADSIKDSIEASQKTIIASTKDVVSAEKSVLETDVLVRRMKPFVKLSPSMESFVKDFKSFVKTGILPSTFKAMSEGTDTAGGFTVPEEFQAEVIRYSTVGGIIRPRARVVPMSSDKVSWPKLDQDTATDNDHFAGVLFYELDEAETATESTPRFGRITLSAKKAVGLTVISNELLEDSAVNIANFIVSLFGEAWAWKEDKDFLRGTGVGQPLGVINAADRKQVTRTTSSRIKHLDVFAMDKALPAQHDAGAVWLTTKAGREQLLIADRESTTNLFFQPNLRDGYPQTLLGKPFIVVDDNMLPALGSVGDIVLGNFSRYFIGDRGGMRVDTSIHDKFREDQVVIRTIRRRDGQPAFQDAFVTLTT